MKPIFGLDFGTTNSALSVLRDGKVEIINIGHNNLIKTLRSVLYFYKNDVFVGDLAVNEYLSNHLNGRFMQSIKSILSSTHFGATEINNRRYTAEDLVSIILRTIKERGEKYLGHEVTDVVMGRPVIFSEDPKKDLIAENRLRKSAQMVGFKNIKFQLEPIAAALTYEQTINNGEEKIVLIGDFGGGTSDFSVIKLRGGNHAKDNRKNDVLSIGGIYIAGEAFDSRIMFHKISPYFGKFVKYRGMTGNMIDLPLNIFTELCSWHRISRLRERKIRDYIGQIKLLSDDIKAIENLENIIDHDFGFLLFREIEESKIRLTNSISSEIFFSNQYLTIRDEIQREEFNHLIKTRVDEVAQCLDLTIKSSGLEINEIDTVFTTGGTSQIPIIKQLFIDRFGTEKMTQMDAFTSVAQGLGESAKYLFD